MTESIRLSVQGQYLTQSFSELLDPRPDFDAEEIIDTVLKHAGTAVRE